jgi:hypothetical protein
MIKKVMREADMDFVWKSSNPENSQIFKILLQTKL